MDKIDNTVIENVSRILGEETSGAKLTNMFFQLQFYDHDNDRYSAESKLSTKWRRINHCAIYECNKKDSAQPFFKIIEYIVRPQNYINEPSKWSELKRSINANLIFYGYELTDAGKIKETTEAHSFSDAQQRLNTLQTNLANLNIHPEILKFCNTELLEENYFHAILEASKAILNKIRLLSELDLDGNTLINQAFIVKHPIILIKGNNLMTDEDKSEYNGLKSLLNTIVYLYRNPKAHNPKLYDKTSLNDATTAFSMMSFACKKLDSCINVRNIGSA